MSRIATYLIRLQIWKDSEGQDLIEYALMAGLVAVAAGTFIPSFASSISTVLSKIGSTVSAAVP
jgi:pilus assembly protein Flp/PilA